MHRKNTPATARQNRAGLAVRGAIAAASATAVLLGGFGAFALWTSEPASIQGDGNLARGRLGLVGPTDTRDGWTFGGNLLYDGGFSEDGTEIEYGDGYSIGDPVNLDDFVVSPGDILIWTGEVQAEVFGSNIAAAVVAPELTAEATGNVAVTFNVTDEGGDPVGIIHGSGDAAAATHLLQANVRIEFRTIEMNNHFDLADLMDFEIVLQQVQPTGEAATAPGD